MAISQMQPTRRPLRLMTGALMLALLAGCDEPFDFDLRGKMGGQVDTSDAALKATARRPRPDDRGIISYPNYQVAVARRGDTVADVAQRIGVPAGDLARYNGIKPDSALRAGEVIALPRRVAEPVTGPIRPPSETEDLTRVAGEAIDRAESPSVQTAALDPAPSAAPVQTGVEPVRHQVERGESAYTIARLYNVSVRALASWNGLGPDFAVREGQYLLIPTVRETPAPADPAPQTDRTTVPGQGSPTPTPPSATKPLPQETTKPAAAATPKPAAPDLGATQTRASASAARMILPVDGRIVRAFAKGRTDGIDIAGTAGASVKAADSGRVGAITADSKGQNIVVLKHADGLLTVYGNVGRILVKKGDSVSRGQKIAEVGKGDPAYVRFGVYKGSEAVDPTPYIE